MEERNPDKGDSYSMIDKDGNESNMTLHLQCVNWTTREN